MQLTMRCAAAVAAGRKRRHTPGAECTLWTHALAECLGGPAGGLQDPRRAKCLRELCVAAWVFSDAAPGGAAEPAGGGVDGRAHAAGGAA
eukprot:359459-Chlamydomonas_euryale.AAC.6